ncbi:sugar phosphate isomerase/epimerase family protein [Haloarculaceae archaeon H-GB11]|nr:sugar phosphate isomerase/epimerase family protein [Haloarculaceae archaeon H-GB11]
MADRRDDSMSKHYGASLDLRMAESPTEFVDFLDSLGLSHVEIRHSYLDTRPETADVEALRELRETAGVTYTIHAPYNDCNPGNLNEPLRKAMSERLVATLDLADAIGAGAVVTHGGAVRRSYPDRVQEHAREQAVRTIREAARHADEVEVPLCVENQRAKAKKRYNTSTPERLAAFLDDVDLDSEYLGVTLDVGHAKATGVDYEAFVDRFGDGIRVAHLHDNDGTDDDHDPIPDYEAIAADIGAPYNVLEMKSKADVERCVGSRPLDE